MWNWSMSSGYEMWKATKGAPPKSALIFMSNDAVGLVVQKQLPEHATKDAEATSEDERLPFVLCHYTVFNVEQCDGLTLPEN